MGAHDGAGPASGSVEVTADAARAARRVAAARAAGWSVARLAGDRARTVTGVLDESARAWSFPDYFGRNRDALDECMRELPETAGEARGYLTVVDHGELLLADVPGERGWLAESWNFYAAHYRGRRLGFAVLLHIRDLSPAPVAAAWRAAGADVRLLD